MRHLLIIAIAIMTGALVHAHVPGIGWYGRAAVVWYVLLVLDVWYDDELRWRTCVVYSLFALLFAPAWPLSFGFLLHRRAP